ncbi:MAG: replication factor C large subunit [Methanomassiliicoccales archaeon]|nr:MAG: replication factor C large subunit [Methanomassiliicoccales archaeon]
MNVDWAEKYRPKRLNDVVGNPTATKELRDWAETWERGTPKKKAVVLVGDPGVGKTSSALALAREFGWGIVELNASDLRNADAIRKVATSGALNETFTDSGEFVSTRHGGRKLIILDEADNIFGKEDYGGIQAIVMTIRETLQPIILIVNDYYALVRRSPALKSMCHTIRFSGIHKSSVIKLLRTICQNEDITVSNETLNALAEHSSGDLRSAINDLESLSLGKRKISEKDVTVLGFRDYRINIFKALTGIFRTTSYNRALESAYNLNEDPEHLLLWIDENLPLEYKKHEDLASAYYSLSRASIFLGRVRIRQHYKLWGYANDLMTAGVAVSKTSSMRGYTKYQFPSWLTKMSQTRGIRTLQKSLNEKLSSHYHTSRYVAQIEMFPYFRYLFENEKDFNIYAIRDLDLDSEEIAYILGEETDSPTVKHLLEKSKDLDKKKKEEKPQLTGSEKGKKEQDKGRKMRDTEDIDAKKAQDLRQKNLSDF